MVDCVLLRCLFFHIYLWVNFDGIGTCFDVVQYGCFLLCCLVESLDDVNTVAARFLNLNARSFHDAAAESKLDNIETARDSMKDTGSLDPRGPKFH